MPKDPIESCTQDLLNKPLTRTNVFIYLGEKPG